MPRYLEAVAGVSPAEDDLLRPEEALRHFAAAPELRLVLGGLGQIDISEKRSAEVHKMVEDNLGLVIMLARSFNLPSSDTDDLIQEGILGLYEAVEKFDPGRSQDFSAYASRVIKNAILRAIREINHLTEWQARVYSEIRTVVARLNQEFKRIPTIDEIYEACQKSGTTIEKINRRHIEMFAYGGSFYTSLDNNRVNKNGGEGDFTLRDHILVDYETPEKITLRAIELEQVTTNMEEVLDERETAIIEAQYGLNGTEVKTQRQLKDELGISQVRVGQLHRRALTRLKNALEQTALE